MPPRLRRCRPRGSQKGENTIMRGDFFKLRRELLHDPRTVLGHFAFVNIGFLSELECWPRLAEVCSKEEVARIVSVAAEMGIAEKPPKPQKGKAHAT